MTRRADTFASLHVPNYRLWIAGHGVSHVGFFVQVVAMAILVLELTESGTVLGMVTALNFVPIFLVGPWSGVLSDRVDKRRLLMGTQAVTMLAAFTLGVLVLAGLVTLVWVVLMAAVSGTAFAFSQSPRRTIVTELVDDHRAANAVSLNGAVGQGAKIVGPAVGGALISMVGIGWCFVFTGVASIAMVAALLAMDGTAIRRSPPVGRERGQIADGFRYVLRDARSRMVLIMLGAVTLLAFHWNVLLPLLATRDLGGTAGTFALLMGAMSVGSLGGVLWLARFSDVGPPLLAKSCTAFGVALMALALAPVVPMAAIAAAAVGWSSMTLFNGGVIVLQLGSTPDMRGRVMAIFSMTILGGLAIGGPVAGWAAESFGARSVMAASAVASLTAGLVALESFRREGALAPRAAAPRPSEPWPEPAVVERG